MKAPKKPKYAAQPKAPKMNGTAQSWKNYEDRVAKVTAENQKKKAAYEKELKQYEAELKKRQAVKDKARDAKSKL